MLALDFKLLESPATDPGIVLTADVACGIMMADEQSGDVWQGSLHSSVRCMLTVPWR